MIKLPLKCGPVIFIAFALTAGGALVPPRAAFCDQSRGASSVSGSEGSAESFDRLKGLLKAGRHCSLPAPHSQGLPDSPRL